MTTLEQLESDARLAWEAFSDYDAAGKQLRDKWIDLLTQIQREKLKAEILAELTSKQTS